MIGYIFLGLIIFIAGVILGIWFVWKYGDCPGTPGDRDRNQYWNDARDDMDDNAPTSCG